MVTKSRVGPQTDEEFLAGFDPSLYKNPALTVDVVILTVRSGVLYALLVRRQLPPRQGSWALPGKFIDVHEDLDRAARDVLLNKGGIEERYLEQLYTFGALSRDPRPPRVISVAYMALADLEKVDLAVRRSAGERCLAALRVGWKGEAGGPVEVLDNQGTTLDLAFDHAEILGTAVRRLRGKIDYTPLGFELLPSEFTLRQLQVIHEAVLGRSLNKDSFRRRMLSLGQLHPTGRYEANVAYRPAELYRFASPSKVKQTRKRG